MTPEDPRHGTYAGYMAHRKEREPACLPCATVHRRKTKSAKMRLAAGVRNRIPLGETAWEALTTRSLVALSETTGLSANNLRCLKRTGPDAIVLRSTRDAILAADSHTPIGIQRRLQALAALGYCMAHIAPMVGTHQEPLVRMMRRPLPPQVVKRHVAEGVLRAYEQLHMVPAADSPHSKRRRGEARKRGWAPPLAWDSIDTDPEPSGGEGGDIDPVVVMRLLEGDRVPATKAEKDAAMEQWVADGGSKAELCRWHGWHEGRYGRPRLEVIDGGAA